MGKICGLFALVALVGCSTPTQRRAIDVNALPGFHITAPANSTTGVKFTVEGASRIDFIQAEAKSTHPGWGLAGTALGVLGMGVVAHELADGLNTEQGMHQAAVDKIPVAK